METQDKVLQAISLLTNATGYPPTVRELAEAVDRGSTTVQYHINHLVEEGKVERIPGQSRTLVVTDGPS